MLENTWYSVISPESCSSILWRSWDYKEQAAEALKLTSNDMKKLKLVDSVIKEPANGAHRNQDEMFSIVKREIKRQITLLSKLDAEERCEKRMKKFTDMGVFK